MYDLDILKSGLQKYVRRNIPDKALFCLRDLIRYLEANNKKDSKWQLLLNRIAIISAEDISIGDADVVAHVLKTISRIKNSNKSFPDIKSAWDLLSPLIVSMCAAEKTREFAHIYFAVIVNEKEMPNMSLASCLENKHIDALVWLKLVGECCPSDRESCLDLLETYHSPSGKLRDLYQASRDLIAGIGENIWFYGFLFLSYLRDVNIASDKLFSTNLVEMDESDWEVDDFVVDKHTKLGKLRGKTLKDFVHEGSLVSPVSDHTTPQYKKVHDEMYG